MLKKKPENFSRRKNFEDNFRNVKPNFDEILKEFWKNYGKF